MKLSDFDYNLPKELIAQFPLARRDNARLLVLNRKEHTIEHRIFKDIVDYFRNDDYLILNDTKVLPCRLKGLRVTGGKVEVLLISRRHDFTFRSLIKPSRLRLGEKITFNGAKIYGIVSGKDEITFKVKNIERIYNSGVMPLPPYIKRDAQKSDNLYYQTVYARHKGAIAAPTAGLHFTKNLIRKIESYGVNIAYLTLHVGLSTFKPVKVDDISKHKMEAEYFKINKSAAKLINKSHQENSRLFAVGTTVLRALETYGACGIKEGCTDLFIYPGYKFNIVDCLLTNFHLPRTTLFMLVCAFAGEKFIKQAYRQAIAKNYRFYSYGDAMLIL